MKIRTQYNFESLQQDLEKANSHSETVPDQTLSVRDILERFRRGTLSPDSIESTRFFDSDYDENDYELEDDFEPNPIVEDLTDLTEMVEKVPKKSKRKSRAKSVVKNE